MALVVCNFFVYFARKSAYDALPLYFPLHRIFENRVTRVTQPRCTKGVHPVSEGVTGDTRVTQVCGHSTEKSQKQP